jgi:hypothetical protein
MKILNIHLKEFTKDELPSIGDLHIILSEDFGNDYELCSSKRLAENVLENQSNSDVRVFYWYENEFNGDEYIQLYETLYD